MSRYAQNVIRETDGAEFLLVTGTDHAGFTIGMVPHCFAQIFGDGVDCTNGERDVEALLWQTEQRTPAELVEALNGNPILRLGEFRGPYEDSRGHGEHERWLSDYALDLFARELEALGAS